PRGVRERLTAAEVGGLAVDDEGVAAEFGDPSLEGHPGAQARLVEDHRDRTRSGERPMSVRVGLHLGGEVEHPRLLLRAQVVVAEKVANHHGRSVSSWVDRWAASARAAAASSAPGRAARNASTCSAVMTNGGARRITSGCTGLTRKPASRNASAAA